MRKPRSVQTLTELGRVRLSKSFFMRDMLYSEIAQVHGLLNVPDDPDLAIAAGTLILEVKRVANPEHDNRAAATRSATKARQELAHVGCRVAEARPSAEFVEDPLEARATRDDYAYIDHLEV